jgi:hypothetical protein
MQRATTFSPFVQFLADMECETDDEVIELMDSIADTLGDMFGCQSDRYDAVERFVTRLRAAADAAAQDQVMSRN